MVVFRNEHVVTQVLGNLINVFLGNPRADKIKVGDAATFAVVVQLNDALKENAL